METNTSVEQDARAICAECGKGFSVNDMIRYGASYVCATCKPIFMQKLAEGASISSGSLTGTEDASAPAGLSIGSAFSRSLSINADGSGNLGANTVAVTNGTVLYFIDETGTSPPVVQVFEQ